MFSDTKFWRLVWKEYRTQRALWLTLLIGTPVLQVALLPLVWTSGAARPQELYDQLRMPMLMIGYLASAVYVLGCGATLFSVEHETGTFDFQRVLPVNQARVFWAKIWFALVSSLLLTLLLLVFTRGVFIPTLPPAARWFQSFGWVFLAEVFVWSVLCSLLIKQPLWGVIAAIGLQTSVVNIVLPSVARLDDSIDRWACADERLTTWRIVIVGALAVTEIVLGKLWFEDRLRLPRWRFRSKPNIAPSDPLDAELPAYVGQRQIGWSRLLWLSWRDERWLIAGFLTWYAYQFFTMRDVNYWELLMFPGFLGSFAFGLFAFASEQWGSRFRFMAEHGCSPRHAWLCRQVICLPPVLLMCVGTAWMQSFEQAQFRHSPEHAAYDGVGSAIGPLLCYSAGQLAALLVRSTVVAIAVGVALAAFGFMWGSLMTSWLAPVWWSVGSLPVIGLFVTWLKADDWVEERRDRVARWRLALGLGIPIFLLLATCATYRVVQIPVVQLPAEWEETDNTETTLSPAEKEARELYRRASAEQAKAAQKRFSSYETRRQEIQQAQPEWDGIRLRNEVDKILRPQWVLEMAPVIALLAEAHSRPAVALDFLDSESPRRAGNTSQSDVWTGFSAVLAEHARHQLDQGNLDGAWQDFEIEWELLRRAQRRVTVDSVDPIAPYEERLREAIVEWGRHPSQSRDDILKSIRQLESVAQQDVVRHEIRRQLVTGRSLVEDYDRWCEYAGRNFGIRFGLYEATSWWMQWRMQPWERWRFERQLRRQVFFAVAQADGLKRQLELHQPLTLTDLPGVSFISFGPDSSERTLLQDTTLPPNKQGGFQLAVFRHFLSRAEAFRVTILRLALSDFHREHGHYPKTLGELTPTYFAEAPRDLTTGQEFLYFPNGVNFDISPRLTPRGNLQAIVPKGSPFLVTSNGTGSFQRRRGREEGWVITNHRGIPLTTEAGLMTEAGLANARIWLVEPPRQLK